MLEEMILPEELTEEVKPKKKKVTKKAPSQVELLEAQVAKLTLALAKIATLTGYGNHLKEFSIEKWTPKKQDMGKKYT